MLATMQEFLLIRNMYLFRWLLLQIFIQKLQSLSFLMCNLFVWKYLFDLLWREKWTQILVCDWKNERANRLSKQLTINYWLSYWSCHNNCCHRCRCKIRFTLKESESHEKTRRNKRHFSQTWYSVNQNSLSSDYSTWNT